MVTEATPRKAMAMEMKTAAAAAVRQIGVET
jgi:hypothetical protein